MSVVREKARETGLGESVSMLIDICPEDTAQQLQFCLDQLEQPASEIDPSLGDSEDEEEEVCDSSDVEVDEYFVCVPAKMFILVCGGSIKGRGMFVCHFVFLCLILNFERCY